MPAGRRGAVGSGQQARDQNAVQHNADEGRLESCPARGNVPVETHSPRMALDGGLRTVLPAAAVQITIRLEPRSDGRRSLRPHDLPLAMSEQAASLPADVGAHLLDERTEIGGQVVPDDGYLRIRLDFDVACPEGAICRGVHGFI